MSLWTLAVAQAEAAKKIADLTRCEVQLVDFADNCRDEGNNLPFTVADLTKPIGDQRQYWLLHRRYGAYPAGRCA
jgi:hypothetical protein